MCLRIYCFGVQKDPSWVLYFKWILPIIIALVLYYVFLNAFITSWNYLYLHCGNVSSTNVGAMPGLLI